MEVRYVSNLIFVFDTETSGLPAWNKPSESKEQPHIVQIAAMTVDINTREIINQLNLIIKPDGWTIPQDVIEIHGITNKRAHDEGISETTALIEFLALWNKHKQVAFNTTFDRRIIRIGLKRFFDLGTQQDWHDCDYECAMIAARKAMGTGRNPKLTAAYLHYFGKELEGAHDAMADTIACKDVYFAIKDAEQLREYN